MPILFIHGVAIRQEDEPQWAVLHRLTRGVNWPQIEAALRTHVAPVLRPDQPGDVEITFLYWGDLGARYTLGGRFRGSRATDQARPERFDTLAEGDLGEAVERFLLAGTPVAAWPVLVEAAWAVARDLTFREVLSLTPPAEQWPLIQAAVQTRLPVDSLPEVPWSHLSAEWQVGQRRNLQHALTQLRRPLEAFFPIFVGDVLCYLGGRGTAGQPGPIVQRVLDGLRAAQQAQQQSGEPLVVLTHSLGGQLLYDALTTFVPADPTLAGLKVDFWAAVGSQLGFFRELGLALEGETSLAHSPHLGYCWTVWSSGDLLSFRAEGIVAGTHDTDFPLGSHLQSSHLAYLHHPDFYRMLAAKIRVQSSQGTALEP